MENLSDRQNRISELQHEIYQLLTEGIHVDASKAEKIVEENLFIIAGLRNQEIVKKINSNFHQIQELQAVLGIS